MNQMLLTQKKVALKNKAAHGLHGSSRYIMQDHPTSCYR